MRYFASNQRPVARVVREAPAADPHQRANFARCAGGEATLYGIATGHDQAPTIW